MQPTSFEWIEIGAILVGPVLALTTQRILDHLREKKRRRVDVYLTLMALRAAPLNSDHVRALNSLDTVFDRRSDKEVRECWGRLLQHASTDATLEGWNIKLLDRRVDLYQAVGRAVGYDHSIDYIKNRIYNPTLYKDIEMETTNIRKGLAQALLSGSLKVSVTTEDHQPIDNQP